MNTRFTHIVLLGIIALVVIIGAAAYPQLPEQSASHWGFDGKANDTMDRFWLITLFVGMMAFLYLLFWVIPKLDPLRKNINSFRKYYNVLWIVISLFLFAMFVFMVLWNLGHRFDIGLFVVPGLAVLFYVLGWILERSKRNWFVGIRTPWTMSSDTVWEKTHRLGGPLFKLAAAFALLSLLFADETLMLILLIGPVVAIGIVTIVYSYIAYKQEKK